MEVMDMTRALVATVLVIIVSIMTIQFSRGPLNWPLVGMLPWMLWNISNLHEHGSKVVNENGGTFKFKGPWWWRSYMLEIIISTPANLEYVLKKDFANFPKGRYFKEALFEIFGDGLFTADNELWKRQRMATAIAVRSSAARDKNLSLLQNLFQEKLLPLLEEAKDKRSTVDLQDILLQFSLDNVCMTVFGRDAGSPDNAVRFTSAFDEAILGCSYRLLCPPFLWRFMRFLNVGFEKKMKVAEGIIREFISDGVKFKIKELEEVQEVQGDILSSFIKLEAKEGRSPSEKQLQDLSFSIFFASRDTSAVAVSWFFWLLSMYPNVEENIISELSSVLKSKHLSTSDHDYSYDTMGVFGLEELKSMKYLHAALSESMRLYPPVPADIRESAQDNVLPDGTQVKKGQGVAYFIYATNRMKAIWGEDAEEFKPERWINREGISMKEWDYKYPVFNAGPRLCLGRDIAYVTMKYMVANILARYQVKIEAGHPVKSKIGMTLFMKHGLMVTLHTRKLYIH